MSNGLLPQDEEKNYANFLAGQKVKPEAVPVQAIDREEEQYSKVIKLQDEAKQEQLRQSLMLSVNKNPDQAAQIERLSQQSGIPQPVVERNLAKVIAESRTKQLQDTARFSPILGQQLTNPEFAQVAYDDVPNLSGLEYVLTKGRDYAGSLGKGVIGQGAGTTLSGFGELYGVASRQLEGLLDQVLPNSAMSFLRTPIPWYVSPEQILKRPGEELKDFGKMIGAPENRRGFDTDVIEAIGQLGFQITAALTTGGATSTSMLTAQGADIMAEKTRKDDASQSQKDAAIIAGSGITALTERYGIDRLLNRVPPEVRNRTLRFLADKAAAFGIEFAQEVTEGLLHDLVRRITTNENAPILEGALYEGSVAGVAAAIVRAGLGVRSFRNAKDQENFFRAVADNSQNSKLRERLPERFQDLVRKISEGGPVQNVFIPADQFRTYYQDQGIDPAAKAAELGVVNYTEAAAAGTDVVIPIDQFTAKIAPTDDLQGLFNDLRLSQGDMTAREYERYRQDEDARLEEIKQRAAEITGEVQVPAFNTIKQSMLDNLVATGYEQRTADAYATVYAKTITNLAERSGINPVVLHQRYDLTVSRPLPDVLTRDTRSDVNIDPLLDRLRAGDLPTNKEIYGKSLTDFLIERGGIQPVAELTDIDLDRGPFQRKLLQPTGMDMDTAIEAAVEAGYLGMREEGLTESDLYDAILGETAGQPAFSFTEINEQMAGLGNQLDQLDQYLKSIGIDIDEITDNAEVRRLIEQASQDPEIRGAFDRLFQAGVAEETQQDQLNSLTDMRVSPRLPTAVAATEEIMGEQRLQPDLANSMRDPKQFEKNIGLMLQYPNFKGLEGTPEQQAEAMIAQMVDNLMYLYNGWRPEFRQRSRRWYVGGNRIATRWAERFQVMPQQVAGIIAATSPQKDWFQNVSIAERILEAVINNSNTPWTPAMSDVLRNREWGNKLSNELGFTPVEQLQRFEGKTMREMYDPANPDMSLLDMAVWIRAWDEANNPQNAKVITPEGAFSADLDVTIKGEPVSLRAQSFGAMVKSIKILTITDPAQISEVIGANHKVRSFYNNIIAPYAGDDVTIDTHAVAAALLRPLGSSDIEVGHNFGSYAANSSITGMYGTYGIYAEAYRRAAAQAGVLPREMQSITWEAVRGLFKPQQKTKKNKQIVDNLWDNVSQGQLEIDDVRNQISELVGGIADPTWSRYDPGSNEAARDSSYAPELPGVGVPGRAAEGADGLRAGGVAARRDTTRLFQGEGLAGQRGFIQFGPERKFKIALLEKADLSTFLHESGHFYLEVLGDLAEMPDANQQIRDDYTTVLKFLELDNRGQLTLDGKKSGSAEYNRAVQAHEKFARANEAYLMEGKAPSAELRSIFQRFRNWLKLVYKELVKLNVELTTDVRQVFDRLYATDEEIDAAKGEMSFDPLFLDAAAAGMTDAEFEAYRQSVAQATESGKEALQQKLMRELQRERESWWKAELANVREEVTAEVDALPVYQAFKELTEGEIKLNKEELVERFGQEYVRRLPRGFQRVYTTKDGMPLDAAARMLNYATPEAMVEALVGMKPRNEYIKAESDRVMRERHGDMMTDGTIADEAKIALHNTQREKVLASELRALRRKQREVAPFLAVERERQAGERRAARAAMEMPPISAFRLAAKGMIGQTAIRDLEPQRFLNAQRREGKKAFEAMGKGDFTAAAEAKQKEMLNHFLYLEARKARDQSDKIAAYMRRFEKKETRQRIGKAGKVYLEQIDAILDSYEFRRLPNKTIDRRTSLNAFVANQEEAGEPVNIPVSVLEDARQINYRLLSVDELSAVNEAVRNIANLASLKNKLTLIAEKRTLDEVASEAIEHIRANAKGGRAQKIETALPGEQLTRWARGFMLIHKKFATFFRQMDGWQDGGMMWNLMVKPLNARADFEAVERARATQELRKIFRAYRDSNMFSKTYVPALGQGMTLQGRLMVALNWGRTENRQRLTDGNGFTQAQIDGIFETLTERDWQFVKDIWTYIDSYWPQISEQYERLYGVPPQKSDNAPFMTKYGMMPGGYFPIKYDPIKSTQAQAQTVEEVSRLMKSGAYVRSQTKNGFTKEVLENLDRAIKLDFSPIYEHVNEVIHDLAMREYLLDTNKLLNHRIDGTTLKDTINEIYGDQAYREIIDTIRDVAAGDIGAQHAFDAALGHLRAGVSIIGMGWNLMTGLLQPLGLTQSIVRIGPKWMAKGLFKWGSDAVGLQNSGKFIYEKSPFMRTRNLTQNREINEIRNQIKRQGKFPVAREAWGMVEDSYFQFIIQLQKLVDFPTWLGAYEKALAYGKSDGDAVLMADQAVIDAQSGGQIKDLAKIQRGSQLMKIWTNFYSYFNTTFNLTLEAFGKTKFTDPISVGRLAVDVLMLYTVPAILGIALREGVNLAIGGDEPDEEELIDKMLREQLTYMMGTMVGVREFATIFDPRFGYSGPAGVRFIAEVERLGNQISQGELDDALRKSAVNVGGMLLHFPAGQVNRIIDGIYALEEGEAESPAVVIFGPPK